MAHLTRCRQKRSLLTLPASLKQPRYIHSPLPSSSFPVACLLQLYEQIQSEADVGFALFNKVIPNAVNWYTGEA